jgi:hypothetical protein
MGIPRWRLMPVFASEIPMRIGTESSPGAPGSPWLFGKTHAVSVRRGSGGQRP